MWNEIRHKVLVEGVSKRSVRRTTGLAGTPSTRSSPTPSLPAIASATERPKSKLGPFMGVIDAILEDDKQAPPKQRHTARRIFDRLQRRARLLRQRDHRASLRRRAHRRTTAEVFVPLSQPPGEAQFDFGEATVEIDGERVKAALAVMTLPYSDAFFVSAYPRECTETFQAGHVAAFELLRRRADQDRL